MRGAVFLAIILLCVSFVSANSASMKLLAVSETQDGFKGTIASIDAEIKQGSGRVFIDSFPLSKIDTQISTRMAEEIACKHLELDCSNLDFFYVITAKSSIVGGPSAGAALAVLTASILENSRLRADVAITGTINSGGFIGPVGGVLEKMEAASKNGIRLVLIPPGADIINESNRTLNVYEHAKALGIEVKEVAHLSEALAYFKGEEPPKLNEEIQVGGRYKKTMAMLAGKLCNRTKKLMSEIEGLDINKSEQEIVQNLTIKAMEALSRSQLYSAASYCFGANAKLSQLISRGTMDAAGIKNALQTLNESIILYRKSLPKYNSLTDLESFAVVVERLSEASEVVSAGLSNLKENDTASAAANYGYAKERYYSALSWANFYGDSSGENFELTKLEKPCLEKIWEASERVDYLKIYIPGPLLEGVEADLAGAIKFSQDGSYELCLFSASKVKAEADAVLSSMGTTKEGLLPVLDEMLVYVKRNIVEQTQKGHFPIVGYSYYEYAVSLKETNVVSAYVYAQYARELSNLDMYFPQGKVRRLVYFDVEVIQALVVGLLAGLLVGIGILRIMVKTHSGPRGTRSGKKR